MFRIKICGITNPNDAQAVVQSGADAIGLNFYRASSRFIDQSTARQICDVLPPEIVKTGLFVNAGVNEICQIYDDLHLDLIQLHGDEEPELIARLGPRSVMKVFRLEPSGLEPVFDYLARCTKLNCMPKMILIDATVKGTYGGTGEVADWSICAKYPRNEKSPPLVLAGGLTPSNVAYAIHQVKPAAVDTASGVESSPGKKDPAAVIAYVRAAQEAFGIKQ